MFAWLPATACSKARRSSPSVEQRKQAKCAISSINPPIACLHPTCFGRLARNDVQRTPTLLTSSGFTSVKSLLFLLKPPLRQRSGMSLSLLAVGISLRYRPYFSWCRRLDATHFSAQTFKWRFVSEAASREAPNDPKTSPTRTRMRASAVLCFLPSPLHLSRVKC